MNNLETPLKEGYTIDFQQYVRDGWQLMNREIGTFIGMTILFILIQITLSLIPIVSNLSNLVSTLLSAGYYVYCRNIKRGNQKAGDFFAGFNHAKNIILYLLTYFLLVVPVILLFFLTAAPSWDFFQALVEVFQTGDEYAVQRFVSEIQTFGPSFVIGVFVVLLFLIYLGTSYLFVIPLIVDADMSFWNAMELSRQTVAKKFFTILISLIVIGILAGIGTIITCGLGLLLISPLLYCTFFEAYDDIFKPYEGEMLDELDQFGQASEDINTESQEEERDA